MGNLEEELAKIHHDLLDLAEVIYIIGKLKSNPYYTSYILGFTYDDVARIDRELCRIIGEIQENKHEEKER